MKIYLFLLLSISSFRNQKVSGNEVLQWAFVLILCFGLLVGDSLLRMMRQLKEGTHEREFGPPDRKKRHAGTRWRE